MTFLLENNEMPTPSTAALQLTSDSSRSLMQSTNFIFRHAQRVKFDTADVYGAIDDDNDPENSRWKQVRTMLFFYYNFIYQ